MSGECASAIGVKHAAAEELDSFSTTFATYCTLPHTRVVTFSPVKVFITEDVGGHEKLQSAN
jgi:hypothetical protein